MHSISYSLVVIFSWSNNALDRKRRATPVLFSGVTDRRFGQLSRSATRLVSLQIRNSLWRSVRFGSSARRRASSLPRAVLRDASTILPGWPNHALHPQLPLALPIRFLVSVSYAFCAVHARFRGSGVSLVVRPLATGGIQCPRFCGRPLSCRGFSQMPAIRCPCLWVARWSLRRS